MLGWWSTRVRIIEANIYEKYANNGFGHSGALNSSGALSQSLDANSEERTVKRAIFILRLLLAFFEFAVQFTVILGLAFLFLRLFKLPFWSLALFVYLGLFFMSFFFLFPNFIKVVEKIRKAQEKPLLTKREKRALLGQMIKGYLINATITTIVLFLSAAIVGASPTIGAVDIGELLRRNTFALLGATVSAFFLSMYQQNFELKPSSTS